MRHKTGYLALAVLLGAMVWPVWGGEQGPPTTTSPARRPADQRQAARARRIRQWLARRLPEGVKAHRDLEYAKAGEQALLLDLYVPENAPKPLPVVVWIHGGGWRGGDKRNCRSLRMTARGYAAASVNYRLSQDATFPAQIHDCKAAIRYLRANAAKYGLDPKRIGVWGSSAGGHLVALLGTSGDVKQLEGKLGNQDQSSRVQAVCDWFGPTDLASLGGRAIPGWRRNPVALLLGGPPAEKKDLAEQGSPITHVTKDDPPFLIMHGDRDRVVPTAQSQLLHDALKAAGVASTLQVVEGAGHGFGGAEIDKAVQDFFDKHLKKAKP